MIISVENYFSIYQIKQSFNNFAIIFNLKCINKNCKQIFLAYDSYTTCWFFFLYCYYFVLWKSWKSALQREKNLMMNYFNIISLAFQYINKTPIVVTIISFNVRWPTWYLFNCDFFFCCKLNIMGLNEGYVIP